MIGLIPKRNLRKRRTIRHARSGLTLLEIVLALAIAAIAMSLLAQLVSIGNRAAAASRDETKAQLIAESVIAEVEAGVMLPEDTNGTWETDPQWAYDVFVETQGDIETGMMHVVTVSVTHELSPATFSLTQWVYEPPEPVAEETEIETDAGAGA